MTSCFSDRTLPFTQYVIQTKESIAQTRRDLTPENRATIIAANAPFELRPTANHTINVKTKKFARGILLVHGLLDSPCMMQSLATHFYQQGYLVRALLLPGHGTCPEDLLHITYQDWLAAVDYGLHSLRNEAEHLTLAGFSLGGALALHTALNSDLAHALLLFAPALSLYQHRLLQLSHLTRLATLLTRIWPRPCWISRKAEIDYAKYESLAFNAAYQLYLLQQAIKRQLRHQQLNTPFWMAMSDTDEIVDTKNLWQFFQQQNNPRNRLLLYSNNSAAAFNDARIRRVPSAVPQEQILDYSHICLPIAPEHCHYGKAGDFQPVRSYFTIGLKKYRNGASQDIYQGAISAANLSGRTLKRLSYNPRFLPMMQTVDEFLAHGQTR